LRTFDQRRPILDLALALLTAGIAAAATLVFPPTERPYYFLLGAIVLSGVYGGELPGLACTVVSAALGWFLVFRPEVATGVTKTDIARFGGFVVVCLLVYGLTVALSRTLRRLHTSELRFGGVVQISEDAILAIDEQQRITLFNQGAEKIFGLSAEEALGQSIHILLPERYRDLHKQHVQAFGGSHDSLRAMNERGTIFGRRADGSEFPAEASISKFEAAGEKIMTVRLRDVSERYATDQRLRQMAAIVQSSQDAIISEDFSGRIVSWNPGAERMYGYTAAEVLGLDARMLLPSGAKDEVAENIAKARAGLSATAETLRQPKDGKPLEVALTISPIRDSHGKITGLVTIARDITERKRLEGQLLHSQKMEAVGRLAGGVAHDFNNLLSIIVGHGFLIQSSTPDGNPIRNAADEIMQAAERASTLTRQLLAFSRKQVLRPEVLDLNEVLAGLGKMVPRLIGEDIDVLVVPCPELQRVKADPGQLEQVIMNLVVNARDAMPDGGKLTIETANVHFEEEASLRHLVPGGDYVMLAVSDTGHGMDAATRSRIFEPFFTTKEAGKGTGLGLATVHGIVNQSNGHIWVYSEPGQGTTFKIYFPATADKPIQRQPVKPVPTLCGRETLLLAEDEAGLRELLTHILRDRGYDVLAACDGVEALQLAREHRGPIDLLLTDVVMPRMRGQVLAEELSRLYPAMAIIYMSGYTDNALTHQDSMPKGSAFLPKPFTPDVLLRRIQEVLSESREQQAKMRRTGT
jgi:PAS domain S-box-containing protein